LLCLAAGQLVEEALFIYLFISVFASIIFWLIKKILFLTFSPKFIINAEASHCAQDIVAIKYIFYCNKTDIQ
jgi:hypothetical protein